MNIRFKLATWSTSFCLLAGLYLLISYPMAGFKQEVNLMIGNGLLNNAKDDISNHLISPILFEEDRINGKSMDQFGPNNCVSSDFQMFVGLHNSLLKNFGYPAESQIIPKGQLPKSSRYGKRPVFEIGADGRIFKAYCF